MIRVENLCKRYGSHMAIDHLDFEVPAGQVVGFLGPNGAGKTTTMKILTGFLAPTSGDVSIDGKKIYENPIEAKKQIGYLPETPPLYDDMRIKDYLEYVAHLKGLKENQIAKSIKQVLSDTGLEDMASHWIQNLSKGYRQRVGLAQALIGQPPILILDEPTVALDPNQVHVFRQLIQKLKGKHTILISTHVLSEVEAICDQVIIIDQGKIIARNTLDELKEQMPSVDMVVLEVKKVSEYLIQQIKSLPPVIDVTQKNNRLQVNIKKSDDHLSLLSECVIQTGSGLLTMSTQDSNLEEIFIKLTDKCRGSESAVQ